MCEATYNASTTPHCQSYHLCWGVEGITNTSPANPQLHCPHAMGEAVCVPDAGVN